MKFEIKGRWSDAILFSLETDSLKLCLEAAVSKGADLKGADLEGAYLADIKADFFKILDSTPNEVDGLKKALIEGRIDGSVYSGECACLVGTIANVRKCDYKELGNLIPNADRPAERWFLMFRPGKNHTPERHDGAKITLNWIEEWQAKMVVELKK